MGKCHTFSFYALHTATLELSAFKAESSNLKLKALTLQRKPWPLRSILTLTDCGVPAGQHVS